MRFLFFVAIVFGIFYFFYSKLRRFLAQIFQPLTADGSSENKGASAAQQGRINKGEMQQCPSCGVYFPAGTGNTSGGVEYCSETCSKKENVK
jgi:hypothetical protein